MKFFYILWLISTSHISPGVRFSYAPGFSYSHILLTDSLTISGEIFA